jgi:2',3'-cyclic-nucleotide 2'-phosphodiesterase (5'-nucleotidase family)
VKPLDSIPTVVFLAVASCYRTTEQPRLAGQDVRLTVLHTSDIHSRLIPYFQQPGLIDRGLGLCSELQPFGGAARMTHLLKRERAKGDRVMHLDSGDCFQGAPIFNQFKGEVEMRVMARGDKVTAQARATGEAPASARPDRSPDLKKVA